MLHEAICSRFAKFNQALAAPAAAKFQLSYS